MKSHRSRADTALFSPFCLDGCVMCERLGGPLAGLVWIMAQGQAALIHRQGKSSRSESQLLTVTLPSSSHSNLITPLARFSLSNVICSVYCLYGGVSVRRSHVYRSECMYTHCSCVCVSPCRCETTEWQMIHTKVSRVHRFSFLSLVQLPKPRLLMSVVNVFLLPVFILQISHLRPSHLQQCLSRLHTPPRQPWRAGEWFLPKQVRVETREEGRGAIGPERARTPEPARLNAKTLRRDKRLLTEGKGINTRVAAPTRHANTQVRQRVQSLSDVQYFWLCKSQFPLQLFFVARFRGHSAL